MLRWLYLSLMVSTLTASVYAGEQHGHKGDFTVGYVCVSPGGQLEVEFDFDEIYHLDAVNGILEGFVADDPGFATVDEDELDEGFCVPDPTANIVLEVVAIDSAFKIHTPGFAQVLSAPGDQWTLGAPPFDTHSTWHIDSTDPGYVVDQFVWSLTFRLLDTGATAYSPSEDFTVNFSSIECEVDGWQMVDCNLNGLDDRCEIAVGGAAVDNDGDGLLDECDCDSTVLVGGDVNGDEVTDIADVISLLSALFNQGTPPFTFKNADTNGTEAIDIADAIHLASFLFDGGLAPIDPCN